MSNPKKKEDKKTRDLKAEAGRKRKENYYKLKKKVLEEEKHNLKSLYVIRMPDGWYMMMGNSATVYAEDLAHRLKISVKIVPDRDFRHVAENGIVTFQSLKTFKSRMRALGLNLRFEKEEILIYDFDTEYTEEKIEEMRRRNEVRLERANKLIMPEVVLPELKLRLQELSRAIHPAVRNLDPAGRALVGEIDLIAGKLVEDFILAANGWDDIFLFLDRAIRETARIEAKLMLVLVHQLFKINQVEHILDEIGKTRKEKRMENDFKAWLKYRLFIAFLEARAGKQGTADEYLFEMNLQKNLDQLVEDVYYGLFKPSRGIAFLISLPVMREIFAAPFRDRIIHHFLYDLCAEWWDSRLDYDAYSCRVGKGTLFGVQRLEHHIRSVSENYTKEAYAIQLDIQGYFMSLDREKLVERVEWGLERQFGNDTATYDLADNLWKEIILDDPTDGVRIRGDIRDWDKLPANKSLFCQPAGKGIVIGNLSSQLLSNIYLGQLDMFVRQKLGYEHYGRYVDDFFIIVTKEQLEKAKEDIKVIERYLAEELGLVLHPNKRHIQEVKKGVAFLGMVVYPYHTVPGRRMSKNFHQAMTETIEGTREIESVISYLGRLKHCNGQMLAERVFRHNGLEYHF